MAAQQLAVRRPPSGRRFGTAKSWRSATGAIDLREKKRFRILIFLPPDPGT
jgi:hypothetical protein